MFRLKECSIRRRYSDFEWLRTELERDSKVGSKRLPDRRMVPLPRSSCRHCQVRHGNGKFLHFFAITMAFSTTISSRTDAKVSSCSLTSQSNDSYVQYHHSIVHSLLESPAILSHRMNVRCTSSFRSRSSTTRSTLPAKYVTCKENRTIVDIFYAPSVPTVLLAYVRIKLDSFCPSPTFAYRSTLFVNVGRRAQATDLL